LQRQRCLGLRGQKDSLRKMNEGVVRTASMIQRQYQGR
jgi:hypothetical protein